MKKKEMEQRIIQLESKVELLTTLIASQNKIPSLRDINPIYPQHPIGPGLFPYPATCSIQPEH